MAEEYLPKYPVSCDLDSFLKVAFEFRISNCRDMMQI